MATASPTPRRVMRLQLGILLRRHREGSGRSAKEVAQALDWYPSKLSKLEHGGVTITSAELDRLVELYAVEGEDADKLRQLGQEARRRGVSARVPQWAQTYLELEQAATEIKTHEGEIVPGMLQTEDYARAILAAWPSTPASDLDIRATERAARHHRFIGPNPPSLWVVIGEPVLHRLVGGRVVLRGQLEQLRSLMERSNITVQVLPFSRGEYLGLGAAFTLIELENPQATVVYHEHLTDAEYFDRAPHVDGYRLVFTKMMIAAADERESARMIDTRLRELT